MEIVTEHFISEWTEVAILFILDRLAMYSRVLDMGLPHSTIFKSRILKDYRWCMAKFKYIRNVTSEYADVRNIAKNVNKYFDSQIICNISIINEFFIIFI